SPSGDHTPPALAAMITMPANHNLSSFPLNNFEHNEVITIAVVKLSRSADRKKVRKAIINKSFGLLVVVILDVRILKPPCESINSTMVIAPIRKNRIEDMSPR